MSARAVVWKYQAVHLFSRLSDWTLHASQSKRLLWNRYLHELLTPSIHYTLKSYYFNKASCCACSKWALRLSTRINSWGNELHHCKHLMTASTSPFFSLSVADCPLFLSSWQQLPIIRLSQPPFLVETNPPQHSPFFWLLPFFVGYTMCTN